MAHVYGAGIIMFRISTESQREYLLLQKENSVSEKWAPPKGSWTTKLSCLNFQLVTIFSQGRLEKDESNYDAALREVFEETGLVHNQDYDLISKDYTIVNSYIRPNKSKSVVYWLAKIKDSNAKINLSYEHINFKWFKLNEVLESMKSEYMTDALIKADDYLMKLVWNFSLEF